MKPSLNDSQYKGEFFFSGGRGEGRRGIDTNFRTMLFLALICHYFASKHVFFVVVSQLVGTLILSRYERCQERIGSYSCLLNKIETS